MPIESAKVVGVLGGMGPEATLDLMARVIALTPAEDDADHIRMLIDNNPKVPSRIKALIEGGGESPLPTLIQMARGLEQQGADYLVMPCNTAHYYHSDIAKAVSIPFVNLLEITAAAVKKENNAAQKVGLLASTALQITQLYEPVFRALNMDVLYPNKSVQDRLMMLIKDIKAKRNNEDDSICLEQAARDLVDQGADHLVIACTELSLFASVIPKEHGHTDSADVLSREIVYRSGAL